MQQKCPVCESNTKIFARFKAHNINKCGRCGFGFTSNLVANLGSYYRDEMYIQEEKLFENIFLKRIKKILKFKSGGRVLEVGCSTGIFLDLLQKKGFNVTGVEISEKAAQAARDKGIKVFTKPFENIRFDELKFLPGNRKFDLIIFNHTLEHLKEPFFAIKKSYNLLEDNGLIYIDLPNFGSLSASIYKKNWIHLLPNEHLWHFTYDSLEILLKKVGLKIIFVERSSGIWDVNKPFLELLTSLISLKKRFFINLITALPTFIISKINLGSDLMIIAKKNA